MRIYSKYIIGNLIGPILFVLLTLTGVIWLVQSLQHVSLVVNRGLPAAEFFRLVVLLLPSAIGLIMPIAVLCATIFVYNRLIFESEVLVLKSAGISRFGIAKPAILLFVFVCMVGYLISLYLLPLSFRDFKEQQVDLRDNYAALLLEEGVFNNVTDSITVYVGGRNSEGTLSGLLVHDNRDVQSPVTWMAETGKIIKVGNSVRFLLEKASSQQINRKTGEVRILYFDSYPFDISFYTNNKTNRFRKKDERFLPELFFPEADIGEKNRAKFFAEGHERIIWPLYSLVLPLVAIGIMLSGDFNRRGQTKRILAVIAISVAIILASFATKNIIARGNYAAVALMYIPITFGLIFGLYSLLSSKRIQFKVHSKRRVK